jgi:alkylation response protein AidB-like acyl-CoA dehydrogenase
MSEVLSLIVETATQLFEDHSTPEILRQAEQGIWPAELWAAVEQTGLQLASLPEEQGGAGGNLSDALAVLRVAGQFGVPLPLAESYLAGWVLTTSGQTVPSGPLTVAFARNGADLRFTDTGLNGIVQRVPYARYAEQIVVLAESEADKGLYLTLVSPRQAKIEYDQNLAGEARDTLSFEKFEVGEVFRANVTLDWVAGRAALTRTALMVGALEGIFKRTVRHAGERVQFGRALNQFQAIQQQLALLAEEITAARISLEAAGVTAESGANAEEVTAAIASAKIRAGEAAGHAATIAHQVHAAMGYTYEYPLHFLTRRLWAWRDENGSESEWARWLGEYVARQGADRFWPFLTDSDRPV